MRSVGLGLGFVGLLLGGVCAAQAQDPASPVAGNGERGRQLLAILGPRPPAGFSPLQQQELLRRVRCAATRQQIQDELDVEAAGANGSLYAMTELRQTERESCAPVPMPAGMPAPAPVSSAPVPVWRPPQAIVSSVSPPVPVPATTTGKGPTAINAPAATHAPPVVHAMGSAYTPAPEYPTAERAAGHQGEVMVQLVMNTDGTVRAATVAKSSGYPVLDAAAVKAALTWRIPAAGGDGRVINVPLTFTSQ
ncbi:MAG: energy transducer TonB [Proteobacteria bacterium]|nr:energy transducer TonB [Pseudomonadota bacterium]